MKILALHLPAFHEIPENNEWWGKGFTEWDNVKKGKPLYKGHIQPQIPLMNNYYDLSKSSVIDNQAKMARKYGVDGFVFYHYWFSGKKIFEKPVENLLNDDSINIDYCLCWANETWSRTWEGKNSEVLIKQDYGSEDDWIEHIKYLYAFFCDKRYIKVNGHPVLFIYSMNQYNRFNEMIKIWNDYLEKQGCKAIHLIEFMRAKNNEVACKYSKAVIEFEPLYSIRYDVSFFRKVKRYLCKVFKMIDFQNYDKIWEKIISRKRVYDNRIIYKSCFTAWDNSPRKGKKNSIIIKGAKPAKFGDYFYRLLESKRRESSNEIVIINAWNEWGEGAILEPTENDGFGYLEALKSARLKYELNNKVDDK